MNKANLTLDKFAVPLLILLGLLIYYPVFYTEYVYTDEWVHLWRYGKEDGFHMFIPQGRYLTDKLFVWLFGSIDTVSDLKYIRMFSLFGWLLCLPVWYHVLRRVAKKESLPVILPFISVLYLVCIPGVAISIGWASTAELFIAQTTGLLSGFFLYDQVRFVDGRLSVPGKTIFLSTLFGVISLFTYQNGFGCFLLPFLLKWIADPKLSRPLIVSLVFYFFIYVVYFLLFKYNLKTYHLEASERAALSFDVWEKIKFFFGWTLRSAFNFNYPFNERHVTGAIVYAFFFITWVATCFYTRRALPLAKRIEFITAVIVFFVFINIPSWIIKENYASNRTLIALNIAVFMAVYLTVAGVVKSKKNNRNSIAVICSIIVLAVAWYNFQQRFLKPVKEEYKLVRAFIDRSYHAGIDTVFFIRPAEDYFRQRFNVDRTWDEFGVPSTFFDWVPEFFVKQVVFEKTKDRVSANKIVVQSEIKGEGTMYLQTDTSKKLVIDTETLMTAHR